METRQRKRCQKSEWQHTAGCQQTKKNSYQVNENQVNYYTNYIMNHPNYELIGVYADEGITGTSTKKRENFKKMIADCETGKIDRIIVKSISRFARNTLDCLNYVRRLKELGIGVTFEKENIDTLDAKGEILLTILSSLAQDESRSISENSTWGIRKRFEQGHLLVNTTKFMGYDKDENGNLVINEEQAETVRLIYVKYLRGRNYFSIAKELNEAEIPGGGMEKLNGLPVRLRRCSIMKSIREMHCFRKLTLLIS